jgi:hypothetical protein
MYELYIEKQDVSAIRATSIKAGILCLVQAKLGSFAEAWAVTRAFPAGSPQCKPPIPAAHFSS